MIVEENVVYFLWLLGARQDVGRSCILVSIGGKNIMLDCGMRMGYNDDMSRCFPDFSYITQNGCLTEFLGCFIISHFHLDHCGALPYMSEMVGYDGPIYITYPTKENHSGQKSSQMIKDCMKKVVAVNIHQTVQHGTREASFSKVTESCLTRKLRATSENEVPRVPYRWRFFIIAGGKVYDELEIKAYYAGHVLGAAMFLNKSWL
ncbi:hypothetical protein XELAEV_18037505mg [Xenopus laevis]|uniref:Metallo-beta-lactamase domain-containing protein n=1 Tax=Xenopus laevis TaxID=8355 RepID=A0A974CDE8_XENLA|nr:hypothetical protein XELAEV_18037505mg [Xenopus laevis]